MGLCRQAAVVLLTVAVAVPRRYAYCPNLTIIDTPGFILKAKTGELDNTPDEIMSMVKAQASPPHRQASYVVPFLS